VEFAAIVARHLQQEPCGCDARGQIARTQRGWLKNVVSYRMFYHLEHHLFPAVPTCHLTALADRLARAAPELREMAVF